jgi:transcriptional regulator with XRE-family HTH domain
MPRVLHSDPRRPPALAEMGRNLRALMDAKDMSQADLMRAAQLQMPIDPDTGKPARMKADNISHAVNGKSCPQRATVKALAAALGVEESAFMPALFRDPPPPAVEPAPLLTEVPGEPGMFRVQINHKLTHEHALRVIKAVYKKS